MNERRKLYDPACLTLAEHFLADLPQFQDDTDGLASAVQTAVEDWFATKEAEFDRELERDLRDAGHDDGRDQ